MRASFYYRALFYGACIVVFNFSLAAFAAEKKNNVAGGILGPGKIGTVETMRPGKLIDAGSAVGAPAYHRHLVRPGSETTYLIRIKAQSGEVDLSIPEVPAGWAASLDKAKINTSSADQYVKLALKPSASLAAGSAASFKVMARNSSAQDEITLQAETTDKHKIYYISIDSFGPEYLKLNSQGTGPGKDGDWLTPNLHALLNDGTFYPNHKAHLLAATDMNHASYLSGAYPGRLGLYSVQIYLFGFDDKGNPIVKVTPLDIMYYGQDGLPVTTIFNVVKDPSLGGNKNAFTAYVSGKAWVPEHYRNPVFGLDRIVTVADQPDYITPYPNLPPGKEALKYILQTQYKKLADPDVFLWEDTYTADQAMEVINNEDPDVCYILLAAVDASGHNYGSGKDPAEWNDKNTPDDLSDDISKINKNANREGIIKTVQNADRQLGRLIKFLKDRGTYGDSYIVIESDHNMETNLFAGPPLKKILRSSGYSDKKDYFLFSASQIGVVFLRRDDPAIIPALEKSLEDYRMKNPVTGKTECPLIVLDTEEMKTGLDKATGRQITPAMQLYSEYYIEHRKPGGLRYPDMIILPVEYMQFGIYGAGLGNIGLAGIPLSVPPIKIYVGGHGSTSTQHALLGVIGPGLPKGQVRDNQTYPSDVAPTLYRLQGYKVPESVQGKGLPKLDPELK